MGGFCDLRDWWSGLINFNIMAEERISLFGLHINVFSFQLPFLQSFIFWNLGVRDNSTVDGSRYQALL